MTNYKVRMWKALVDQAKQIWRSPVWIKKKKKAYAHYELKWKLFHTHHHEDKLNTISFHHQAIWADLQQMKRNISIRFSGSRNAEIIKYIYQIDRVTW